MKPRSLRLRLALWHAGLLALTLVILSALTLLLLRNLLSSRLDRALEDYAETTAANIASESNQSSLRGRAAPARLLSSNIRQEWGREVQVVDARTNFLLEKSAGLGAYNLVPDFDERLRALNGEITFGTRIGLSEYPVRVATVPVRIGKEIRYIVQSAQSLGGIEEALSRTSLILLILTPSIFLLSLLGGWFLVGSSLRPVDAMTRTALAMEPGRLAHRIEAPGSDDEIARLASAFNEMMERLDRSFRQIQQFSADASHELKTPLTSIRGEAEVALMSDLTTEEHRRVLRSIIDESERMSAIVENLLLLARADADQIQIRRERVALHEVALETYEQLERIARRKGVALEIGGLEEAEVAGDPLWLGQIATNLLNNAIKYTPEGGTVTLSLAIGDADPNATPNVQRPTPDAQRLTPNACLSVSDTGPGIPAEHLPRIFDRFYRVDSGRSRDAGGVGLGLNIAQWAANAQGGHIDVESEVGKGTTFALCLPLAADPAILEDAAG